jgi:hypothetical protein
MKTPSTGTGLALLALAIGAHGVLSHLAVDRAANASAPSPAALLQQGPTVVWMGVSNGSYSTVRYHRLWSDGRMEMRLIGRETSSGGGWSWFANDWVEVPPPPSGNGFACRTDINGDRQVDGADLGILLAGWGPQAPCLPDATYPCLTIGSGALK